MQLILNNNSPSFAGGLPLFAFTVETTEGTMYQLAHTATQALAIWTRHVGWTRANLILLSIAEKHHVRR